MQGEIFDGLLVRPVSSPADNKEQQFFTSHFSIVGLGLATVGLVIEIQKDKKTKRRKNENDLKSIKLVNELERPKIN